MLSLGEQPDRALGNQRKGLIAKRFQRRQGAGRDQLSMVSAQLCAKSSARTQCTTAGAPVTCTASRRNAAFFPWLSMRCTFAPGRPASMQAIGAGETGARAEDRPRPAPAGPVGRSCSEWAMWRVHRCGSVEAATRFSFCWRSSRSATNISSRVSVHVDRSIERLRAIGVKIGTKIESRPPGVLKRFGRARFVPAAAHMRNQQSERRRRHAIDHGGMRDRARTMRDEFLFRFIRQAGQRCVVEFIRQFETFVAPIGGNVRRLAREIDVVLGVDLDLLGDLRRSLAQSAARRAPDRRRRYSDAPTIRMRCAAVRSLLSVSP